MDMSPKRKDIPMWAKTGHAKPVTRRDFLSAGLIPFAAWAVGPSLSVLLNPLRAEAQVACGAMSASGSYIPFITVNLSGGASLAGGIVTKDLNGGYLPSYSKVGGGSGPNLSYNIVKDFGDMEFPGTAIGGNTAGLVSKFLMGVRNPRGANNAPRPTALDKAAFLWQAVASNDDSAMNPFDVTGLVLKMGLQGGKLPNLGRSDTSTGINQKPAMLPPPAPFVVGNVNDLANALGYTAGLSSLTTNQKAAVARTIANLSSSQLARLATTPAQAAVTGLVDCAGVKNVDLVATGGGDVNPYAVTGIGAEIARIWGVAVTDRTSMDATFGAMVYNAISGNASTVNLNLGGYDYHDSTRTTGDTRDQNAGEVIGKILETAEYLKKPVFVYVCSDGATVSMDSSTADSPWVSDRGIAGVQYMIAYSPNGRPSLSSNQIGGFNTGQAADGRFATGNSPELAAQAVFANYAAWNGRIDFLEANRILGDAALRGSAIKLAKG
jgi:hypothetical protein